MKIVTTVSEMKAAVKELKAEKKTIGYVPTMGFLHEGHLSLLRESRKRCDTVVVSIFVNPAQFGPREDFQQYPRDQERDASLLEKESVDFLFSPEATEMYPEGYRTFVEVTDLQDRLCGRSRPGHFKGVTTVVLKLFQIVNPDFSFFGQKDAQQAIILKRMVKDLNLDVKIEVMPIVRDEDGLALSSRNSYLNPEERRAALVLSRSLKEAECSVGRGERRSLVLIAQMRQLIEKESLARIDYIEVVDPEDLNPLQTIGSAALIALAVFIGRTRLIDNIMIKIKDEKNEKNLAQRQNS